MDLSESAQIWVNLLLLWTGFGIVVGLIAQSILPAGEPRGVFGVLVIGVVGSCIGPMIVSQFWRSDSFNPISPIGLAVSVLASLTIFILYRSAFALSKRHADEQPGEQ